MPLAFEFAAAKTNKYASRESGDTVEYAERPTGGISAVLVDGQGSGKAAKTLSMQLSSQAVTMLKQGVRDGVVARAVHDTLFAFRHGRVSATLDILSVDLNTSHVVSARNSVTPLIVMNNEDVEVALPPKGAIGVHHFARPEVKQFALEPDSMYVAFTDGVQGAGSRGSRAVFDVAGFLGRHRELRGDPYQLVELMLREAISRDDGRPKDDMAIVALAITTHGEEPLVRTTGVRIPLP